MADVRKYPVGIQTFSRIRREEFVYVNKTDLYLMNMLSGLVGLDSSFQAFSPGGILHEIVLTLAEKYHSQVVVIIDNYDTPILEVLHKPEEERNGITKFPQFGQFSTFNCIVDAILLPDFSALCGITDEELKTTLKEDVEQSAEAYDISFDNTSPRRQCRSQNGSLHKIQ